MRWIALAVLAAVLLLAAACAEGGDTGETPTSTAEREAGPLASTGCDPARPHDPGTFPDETITTSDGLEREYILHVPASYSGADAVPLVLNFHAFALSDDFHADYTGLNAKADETGFAVVSPQGMATTLIDVPHWNSGALPEPEPDDVAFVDELLDALDSTLCIDPARVYATGLSNGAGMSVRLACSLSDRIAAIAPVAGVYFPPVSLDQGGDESCPGTRPVPVIAFHGTDDEIIPFGGGLGGLAGDFAFRLSIEEAIAEWAARNGCGSGPEEEAVPGAAQVRLVRYRDCDEGATVELYAVEGGGHTWPDATQDLDALGATTHEISANDLMWDFFQARPLP